MEENYISKQEEFEDIEPEDTSSGNVTITHPFNPNEIDIETPPFTVGYLVDMMEHDEINMNTDFQREANLWSPEKQSRLIESILLGLPLPAFYFDTSNPQWDIIDGLQRCCSIQNFCVNKELRLTGLEFLGEKNGKKYLEGVGFDDLDRTLQRSIITRPITVNLIKKAHRKVRYILFKRLNTGGLELKDPEIRNAIFQGKVANTINDMAKFPEFIMATGGRVPTKRMQDRDFVSRFIAFYLIGYQNYQPGLDDFINTSMEMLEEEETKRLKEDFKKSMNLAFDIFNNDAFRKRFDLTDGRKPLNKAYFEVIAVTFSKLNEEEEKLLRSNQNILKANLIELMNSTRYAKALSGGTGTKDSVNVRFSWFENVLKRSLSGKLIRVTDDNKIKDREL